MAVGKLGTSIEYAYEYSKAKAWVQDTETCQLLSKSGSIVWDLQQ